MSRSSKSWFAASGRRSGHVEEDQEALKWAAIEKLPTYDRLRTSIIKASDDQVAKEIDVRQLNMDQRQKFMDDVFKDAEEDNEKFLRKLRNRINRVGIRLPTVEVRYDHLSIEANGYVGSRALPTLPNTARNIAESVIAMFGISLAESKKLTILKDASGIIKPSRMTLLLGPPSSGKTTLLLALAGKLDSSLKVRGDVTYNGYRLDEFVPQKTSAYISQNDVHVGEMTVKETLDFSARCQGVGTRYDLLSELVRREKDAGIFPEAEVDLFMKATSIEGVESSLITDYVLKILGLEGCKDTMVGDEMHRGISGGQKKRVTTGEMIVGPTKTLFMDEISTGLDSSTTFQIVKCLQHIAHYLESTILISLLQPAPETFDLFDDIILLSEGQIVYHGPRESVFDFFQSCGFKCPERKGTADFLQEVTSRKDQQQYWADPNKPYRYIPVSEFVNKFNKFSVGKQIRKELSIPYDKSKGHRAALVFTKYSIPKLELVKACWDKEVLLMKRNSFFYIFKTSQIIIIGIVGLTVFLRTRLHTRNEEDAGIYMGGLLFSVITNTFNGYPEIALNISRLPVFYKQRDLLFYPAWAFTVPNSLLKVPISILESVIWLALTYYPIGFAPEAGRFFKNFLLVILISQMAGSMFKVIAGVCKVMVVSNTGGMFILMFVVCTGGLILPRTEIPKWWKWGYWVSPLSYTFNAITVNELYAPRWMNKLGYDGVSKLGEVVLKQFNVFNNENWYWIGASALFGFILLFNVLFTLALGYLDPPKNAQAILPDESEEEMGGDQEFGRERKLGRMRSKPSHPMSSFDGNGSREMTIQRISSQSNPNRTSIHSDSTHSSTNYIPAKKGMVLPFTPLAMSFDEVNYYVDMPAEMKEQGVAQDKLQLLQGVTGAFRPGVLTALMGVSGAGKTTLMDVLAGRKTGGYIQGDIRISGFPKKQETFARVSGYCEQTDIHSPQITVKESLVYSAFLRLPKEVSSEDKMSFVDQIMELVELEGLRDAIVGLPGISGLSTEQRKRLTIAVELVANPSIIFMDEPTSGLDARAAAIVMRVVRNTVNTGRTVVCTIHQPSIDIFEAFDDLLLMKRGGQVIYFGPLGRQSYKLIKYFEAIPGVSKIKEKYNPATWMLELSSIAVETRLSVDFAHIYKSSALYQQNKTLVKELSVPPQGANDLHFTSEFSQAAWGQFTSCLWKQWKAYWRTPEYNLVRLFFTLIAALMLGSVFWKVGSKMRTSQDFTLIAGAMYMAAMFLGVSNCQTVQPVVAIERTVFYRERAAGMYSALPYAFAQMACEIPYVLAQATYFTLIVYSMFHFDWTAAKFFWFYFVIFFTFLYFTFYGMMTIAITPNAQVAAILAASFYNFFNLFSGFFITRPHIPKWWVWFYWICPVGWTVTGLIVSQYGDDENTIRVPGIVPDPTIKWYLEHQFGYHSYFMGPVAGALIGLTVCFAFIFAFAIKKLNYQVR